MKTVVGMCLALSLYMTSGSGASAGGQSPAALFSGGKQAGAGFRVNPSVFCLDCHIDKIRLEYKHSLDDPGLGHKIWMKYDGRRNNTQYLRPFPMVYLEDGMVVCLSCHDGYLEALANETRHKRSRSSRGMRTCGDCHEI